MADEALSVEREYVTDDGTKIRLLSIDDIDGRTLAVKRVRATEAAIVSDLGGQDAITAAQGAMVRRAAVLVTMLGDVEARWAGGEQIDPAGYRATVDALRRLLLALGLERRAKAVPSLNDYLAARENAEDDDARD